MPRPATGQVIEREGKTGRTFAIRFRAYGVRRFVTLGTAEDGWGRERAEAELRHVLADVERGIWQPTKRTAAEAPAADTETALLAMAQNLVVDLREVHEGLGASRRLGGMAHRRSARGR
jgi:hypothetical protein